MRLSFRFMCKAHDGLVLTLAAIAAAIAAGLVVLICTDVAVRNLGFGNIPWTNEVTEYGLYGMTLLGAPWVLSLGAHVRMDLLTRMLPPGGVRLLEVFAALVGAGISATLAYFGVVVTLAAHARGSMVLKTLVFPEWILLAFVPFTMMLMAIGFLRRAAEFGPSARETPGAGITPGAG
jgi:TRAP-type C4-dicarboxylate transport system permease small subunit